MSPVLATELSCTFSLNTIPDVLSNWCFVAACPPDTQAQLDLVIWRSAHAMHTLQFMTSVARCSGASEQRNVVVRCCRAMWQQLSHDVCNSSRDVSQLSRNVSQLSRDVSNSSRDVTHFLHNVVITNFETNGLPYAPRKFEMLHALKCVLGAPEVLFRACTQYIYICNLPSSISGFRSKSTTYEALANCVAT